MHCQSSIWKKASGGSAKILASDTQSNYANSTTVKGAQIGDSSCGTARISYSINASSQVTANFYTYAGAYMYSAYFCTLSNSTGSCSGVPSPYSGYGTLDATATVNGLIGTQLYQIKTTFCGPYQSNTILYPWAS